MMIMMMMNKKDNKDNVKDHQWQNNVDCSSLYFSFALHKSDIVFRLDVSLFHVPNGFAY